MGRYSGQLLEKQDYYAKKGIEQGAKSLPAASSQSLDSHETQLLADAQRLAANEGSDYEKKFAAKLKTLAEINDAVSQTSVNCDTLLDDRPLSETVSHAQEQQRAVLVKLRENQLQREAELKAYRSLNAITEKAVYPESPWLPYLVLVPIVLLETVGNAFFYANEQGLLGGAFVAFVVSVVNLAIAFGLGAAFRYKNLASGAHKAAGWGAILLAIALAVYFNAIFSAYRSEYQLLTDQTSLGESADAFKRAMGAAGYVFFGRLPASDLMSFVMFFVGLVLSVIAFRKGYGCDDRYPGHGWRDRLYTEATKKYETELEIVRLKVLGEVQRRVTDLAGAKNQLMQTKARLEQIKNASMVDVSTLQASLNQLQRDFALVLDTYRQKNVSVRPIQPPDYFAETPDIVSRYEPDDSDLLRRLEEAVQEAENNKQKYLTRLNETLRDLENQGRDLQGAGFNQFLDDLTAQAQKNIESRNLTMPVFRQAA